MRKLLILILLNAMLTACGGGSSSSGGGTAVSTAGTYNGSETFTVTIPGVLTETGSGSITITIDAAGNVTLVDEDGVTFTGSLSGNRFTAQGPAQIVEEGITCNGPAAYEGTVSGNQITGTESASVTCTRGGVSVAVNASGTFNATRV